MPDDIEIPARTARVLHFILLALLLILVRVWFLCVIQRDALYERAKGPQRRTVSEIAERGPILDRFQLPLAINQVKYKAAVRWADLQEIPVTQWVRNERKERVRVPARARYVRDLAERLAAELGLDTIEVQDAILAKAALLPHTPYLIKDELSETEYARLQVLATDHLGVLPLRSFARRYPQGGVASDIVGYVGTMSSAECARIAEEIQKLESYLHAHEEGQIAILPEGMANVQEVEQQLEKLLDRADRLADLCGKDGMEAVFDEALRGGLGRAVYEVDVHGNVLRQMPSPKGARPGESLTLTLSAELQAYAEQLLLEEEEVRNPLAVGLKEPWIKGGSIVAMHPTTGEILALASYPHFDPNDFVPSREPSTREQRAASVSRWLETESYIGAVWDGKRPLERERARGELQQLPLSWESYLDAILPPSSSVRKALTRVGDLGGAYLLLREFEMAGWALGTSDARHLIDVLCDPKNDAAERETLDPFLLSIPSPEDRLLLLDLCRLVCNPQDFTEELISYIGTLSLGAFRSLCQAKSCIQGALRTLMKQEFHQRDFLKWRQEEFAHLLRQKRQDEKDGKQSARPYTDYLHAAEKEMFHLFWDKLQWALMEAAIFGAPRLFSWTQEQRPYLEVLSSLPQEPLTLLREALAPLPPPLAVRCLRAMRSFDELDGSLYGHYNGIRSQDGTQLQKHLAAAFYPLAGFGYMRPLSYRQDAPLGSIFKLVVAYEALRERHQAGDALNACTLVDDLQAGSGGRDQILGFTTDGKPITRFYKGGRLPKSHPHIGKIGMVEAIEQSSNLYFSLLAAEQIETPGRLVETAKELGFGEPTGIELPAEISGTLPDDLTYNRTGLYAFAIGQHSLSVTPLQTAVMLAAIANGGEVLRPTLTRTEKSVKRSLHTPQALRSLLLEGMHRVVSGNRGTARPQIIRSLALDSQTTRDYLALQHQLAGKTSTAEFRYKSTLDRETKPHMRNHIWFGGISFDPLRGSEPELVVVVYLRFSESGGKRAAPLAAKIIKRWREIRAKHSRL